MVWMRLLFAALIIWLIWKFIAGLASGVGGPRRRGVKTGVALVRDPVCGTYVEPSRAVSARSGRTTHYFCSKECRRTFLKTA